LVVWMAFGRGSGWDGNLRWTRAWNLPTVVQINRLTSSRGNPLRMRLGGGVHSGLFGKSEGPIGELSRPCRTALGGDGGPAGSREHGGRGNG
jgi:hypothetical protein